MNRRVRSACSPRRLSRSGASSTSSLRVPLRLPIGTPPLALHELRRPRSLRETTSPSLSYLLLRGAAGTAARIPFRYPAVEALTAVLVAGCVLASARRRAVVAAVFCIVLVAISAIDIEHRIVPNRIVMPAAAIVLVAQTLLHAEPRMGRRGRRRLGLPPRRRARVPAGDGHGRRQARAAARRDARQSVAVALMVGCFAALVPAAVLCARHGLAARKMAIPFAPFLAFGAVVALFAGDRDPRLVPRAASLR